MVILKYDSYQKFQNFSAINESVSQDDPNNLMREEVKSDVSRCVSMILTKYPFFGEYIIGCRFLYDHPSVDTMATDGKNIFISSEFAMKLTEEEMIFILCHEILHIMLLHFSRAQDKFGATWKSVANKWNIATDLEINPLLVGEGMLSASHVKDALKALYDEKFIGMSAETIYDKLGNDEPQKTPQAAQDYPANVGDVIYTKDGKWGQITKIYPNKTYDAKDLTEEEARKILGA